MSFTPLDAPYCGETAPLYILAKLNGQIGIGVMVDPFRKVDVIIKETLFVNGWHRPTYDECQETLRTYDSFSISPLGSITLTVLVGPKAISSTFVIILGLDLFRPKLGIPSLISMEAVLSVIHKCIKFAHKGLVHAI